MTMNVRVALAFVCLGVCLGVSLSKTTFAASAVRTDFPCKGCLYWPPPVESKNAPLLVVLHGDAPGGKTPLVKRDSEPFVKAASERGIAVLAPMCPKDEGCLVGSYWQWSLGDPPGWINKQVDAVRQESSIDPDRIALVGWSGGASFLGYHYSRWADRYAAVVFAGGGIAPYSSTCAACSPPVYFMVGNKNPLHHLAKDLKTSVSSCTQDVTWDLLPGMDHGGEWRALNRPGKVDEIVDWLEKHSRTCGKTALPEALPSVSQASIMPSASAEPMPTMTAQSVNSSRAAAPKRTSAESTLPNGKGGSTMRGGCTVSFDQDRSESYRSSWASWAVILASIAALRWATRKTSRYA